MKRRRIHCPPRMRTCLYIRGPIRTPAVHTGVALNILESSAEIIGNTFSAIPGTINFAAVQYSTSPAMDSAITSYGAPASPFSVSLTDLQPNTLYYYRAVVGSSDGSFFGEVLNFTTSQAVMPPAVHTGSATNILSNSATIINNTFSDIPGTISFAAVQYSISPSMDSAITSYGAPASPFFVNLTNLQPNTTYYYRAAVDSSGGSFFGEVRSFTTPQVAVPTAVITGDATGITSDSAFIINNTFSGFSVTISLVGVQYSTSPTMSSARVVSGTIGSPFAVNLTGLQPNTTYYYRAVVNVTSGSHYGQIKSFTTPNRV